jgi:hypothetical protein
VDHSVGEGCSSFSRQCLTMTGVPDSTDADQLYILSASAVMAHSHALGGRLLASGVLALMAGACGVARLRECMFRVNVLVLIPTISVSVPAVGCVTTPSDGRNV